MGGHARRILSETRLQSESRQPWMRFNSLPDLDVSEVNSAMTARPRDLSRRERPVRVHGMTFQRTVMLFGLDFKANGVDSDHPMRYGVTLIS